MRKNLFFPTLFFCFVLLVQFLKATRTGKEEQKSPIRKSVDFITNLLCRLSIWEEEEVQEEKQPRYVYIFAHPLGGGRHRVDSYQRVWVIPPSSICEVRSPKGLDYDQEKTYSALGQVRDIEVIVDEIREVVDADPSCKIIGVGASKGAATWINVMGELAKTDSPYLANIKGLVLESPFTDANEVGIALIQDKLDYFGYAGSWVSSLFGGLTKDFLHDTFTFYNKDGIQPIISVKDHWEKVPKDIFVIFVHSMSDQIIPVNHSRKLYVELLKRDFQNLHLIKTLGTHVNVFFYVSPDGIRNNTAYLAALWTIYKHYGIPHPTECVDDWEEWRKDAFYDFSLNKHPEDFQDSKPSLETVLEAIERDEPRSFPSKVYRLLTDFFNEL